MNLLAALASTLLKSDVPAQAAQPPQTTTTSALDIPEILDHVLACLDRRDIIYSIRRVCRLWHRASQAYYIHPLVYDDSLESTPHNHILGAVPKIPFAGSFCWIKGSKPGNHDRTWIVLVNILQQLDHACTSIPSSVNLSQPSPALLPNSTSGQTPRPLYDFYFSGYDFQQQITLVLPHLKFLAYFYFQGYRGSAPSFQRLLASCPLLRDIHIESSSISVEDRTIVPPLSTIDLSVKGGGKVPLTLQLPSSLDDLKRLLPLQSLKIINSDLNLAPLIDLLAVSPNLKTLEITTTSIFDTLHWHKVSEREVFDFILGTEQHSRQAKIQAAAAGAAGAEGTTTVGLSPCPSLRRLQFSNHTQSLSLSNLNGLVPTKNILSIKNHIKERKFYFRDATMFLGDRLMFSVHSRVITHLEFTVPEHADDLVTYRRRCEMTIDMNAVLFHMEALLVLKAKGMVCAISKLTPFPSSVLQEQGIKTGKDKEGKKTANTLVSSPSRLGRLWACRNLHTLEINFVSTEDTSLWLQSELDGQDTRTVFGYLSRVCPKLQRVYIGLDYASLHLQSGLCLLSRLERLEKAVIQVLKKKSGTWKFNNITNGIGSGGGGYTGADLSWMPKTKRPFKISKILQQRELNNWDETIQKEQQGRIPRSKAFLDQNTTKKEYKGMELLGALTDVRQCLDEISMGCEREERVFSLEITHLKKNKLVY
ncbi:hypothetical protein BG004_005270 [Podila humilis]|nr:hypothetical protein BG004_005270 [Podila humilis]